MTYDPAELTAIIEAFKANLRELNFETQCRCTDFPKGTRCRFEATGEDLLCDACREGPGHGLGVVITARELITTGEIIGSVNSAEVEDDSIGRQIPSEDLSGTSERQHQTILPNKRSGRSRISGKFSI